MLEKLPISPKEFRETILKECIEGLRFRNLVDNFDSDRFNFDGINRSETFYVDSSVRSLLWFTDNYEHLMETFENLSDERSKKLFLDILSYRIAGHQCIRIRTSFTQEGEAQFMQMQAGSPSSLPMTGAFGSLKHYNFTFEGKRYELDCLGLEYYLYRRQYFLDEEEVRIQPSNGDTVIDAGACWRDSAIVFGKAVGPDGTVYSFDPVADHLDLIRFNAKQNPDCKIAVLAFGLSDHDVDCPPIQLGEYSPGFNSKNYQVPLRKLDTLAADGTISKVDFIKMDIEGAELAALRGAVGAIRKFRPQLAISIYHKPDDLFEIPSFIRTEFPFYKMYLGHYTIHSEETVLYCSPT